MDKAFAEHFAADWIEAWNARDLERVLSPYADDFDHRLADRVRAHIFLCTLAYLCRVAHA